MKSYNCYRWAGESAPGAFRCRGTSLQAWLSTELQTLCIWQTRGSTIFSNHHLYPWVKERDCMPRSENSQKVHINTCWHLKWVYWRRWTWAGKRDETRQAQCLEEKQWPATTHGIPQRHSHTNTKHPARSGEKRLKERLRERTQLFCSMCLESREKPNKTKTGTHTHPSPGELCYTTMRRPRLHLNHMIRSFERLLGNYVNPHMDDNNFTRHNWPLARSLFLPKHGNERENCKQTWKWRRMCLSLPSRLTYASPCPMNDGISSTTGYGI